MSKKVTELDVLVVGAGFSGLYLLHRFRALGLSVKVVDRAGGVGGTWYWNRYPGACCDIESVDYSYSFSEELQKEWKWSTKYAAQPEILRYLNHVADRFDLRRDIQLNTDVRQMVFDEEKKGWIVHVASSADEKGEEEEFHAHFVVMGTGCLSQPKAVTADFPGVDSFQGRTYFTSAWPHEPVDFTGLRVGVIGTGSSGIQSIPKIAEQAQSVTVFQRTATFSTPARNGPISEEEWKEIQERYPERRKKNREDGFGISILNVSTQSALAVPEEERKAEYEKRWAKGGFHVIGAYGDIVLSKEANDTAAEFIRAKIKEVVKDPALAEKLTPQGFPVGAKRPCIDTDYFATYNRENVTLVDIRSDPIEAITPKGLKTKSGQEFEFDVLVFATGFDGMTGALTRIDIKGLGGVTLKDKWAAGPVNYVGLSVAGFPNMFMVTGPGSPSVLTNMVVSIEQHVDWITDCIKYLKDKGIQSIEATEEAENDWVAHCNAVAGMTVFPQADSWYVGANVPGKPRVFMPYPGGLILYGQKINHIAANNYDGYKLA